MTRPNSVPSHEDIAASARTILQDLPNVSNADAEMIRFFAPPLAEVLLDNKAFLKARERDGFVTLPATLREAFRLHFKATPAGATPEESQARWARLVREGKEAFRSLEEIPAEVWRRIDRHWNKLLYAYGKVAHRSAILDENDFRQSLWRTVLREIKAETVLFERYEELDMIIRSKAKDLLRRDFWREDKERKYPHLSLSALDETSDGSRPLAESLADDFPSPEEQLLRKETAERVRHVVGNLPTYGRAIAEALSEHSSRRAASTTLGISRRQVDGHSRDIRSALEQRGVSE
jgi:hypothetical protein